MLERIVELVLLGWLLYIMFGATNAPGWEGLLWNIVRYMGLVTYAYTVSGYLVTTFWLRVIAKPRSLDFHIAIAVLLFLGHSILFFLGSKELERLLQLQVFGACIVVSANFIGSRLLDVLWARSSSRTIERTSR
jgi:cation transport ATPase